MLSSAIISFYTSFVFLLDRSIVFSSFLSYFTFLFGEGIATKKVIKVSGGGCEG